MADRYYLVTFDLIGSRGREYQYKLVEDRLKSISINEEYHKLVKQCAIICTDRAREEIYETVRQAVGGKASVLVIRVAWGSIIRMPNKSKQRDAECILDGIPKIIETETNKTRDRRKIRR